MREYIRKNMPLVLACMLAFGAALAWGAPSVQAKSAGGFAGVKAKKAIRAYQRFLGQGKIKWSDRSYDSSEFQFMLADVNADKTPELLVKCVGNVSHYEGYEAVYYFHKNKVKLMAKSDAVTAFYPKKGVVEIQYYGMGGDTSYHRLSKNGKVKRLGGVSGKDDPYQETYYEWGGKKVTKSGYLGLLKKAAGKKKVKIKESGWIDNAAANRASMSMKICVYR